MANILTEAWRTYSKNIKIVLLFSIPFIISFLIPILAPMPSYITAGGIFLRTTGMFINANLVTYAEVVIADFFSLLFLSFAFVAISLIVKAEKTHNAIPSRVLRETEAYTGRVFLVMLFYIALLAVANFAGYFMGFESALTAIVGFFAFMAIFYAPTGIVMDNKPIARSIKDSTKQVLKQPQYFILWFVLIALVVSALDAVLIPLLGLLSAYALLLINALLVVPYFVILQTHAYMRKYSIFRH